MYKPKLYSEGRFNEFGGFIFGGAYTWSGLFSEFYGIYHLITSQTANTGLTLALYKLFSVLPRL